MNIFLNPSIIFKSFELDYHTYKTGCYKPVDDSVILICGLRSAFNSFFEVYYTCVPVFSYFSLLKGYLNDFSAFNAGRDSKYKTDRLLPIHPEPEAEQEIIDIASVRADYAYNVLENIHNLDDSLTFYNRRYKELYQKGICCSPDRFHLDILIFRRQFDELKALLNKALTNNVRWAFRYCGMEFPEDGNWRTYLPTCEEDAVGRFKSTLYRVERSCWKPLRTMLEEGRYYELCSELMENYQKNKKLLKRVGIQLGEKADMMMEEMMRDVESFA